MPKGKKAATNDALIKGVLSESEIEAIKAQARKNVMAEKKAAAEEAILEHEEEMLRRAEGLVEVDPNEELVEVEVDLGPYVDRIRLDNTVYMHGGKYKVRKAVADVILETCWRTWRHEAERKGEAGTRAADIYKPRNTTLGPRRIANAPAPVGASGIPGRAA